MTAGDRSWISAERTVAALDRLDDALDVLAASPSPDLREAAVHLLARPGKRLRPALLLLAAEWGDWDAEVLVRAAAAVEALHVATLYHDDVIDEAATRRGSATVNALWGKASAEAAGTYLLVRATEVLAELGAAPSTLTCRAALMVCKGELHEAENAYNLDLPTERYFEILGEKTAALFELPCLLGLQLSGSDGSYVQPLAEYARSVGLAFQLIDDALDYSGDPARLGKALLTDLRQGVYTLPVLFALESEPELADSLRARLALRAMDDETAAEVAVAVHRSGSVMRTMHVAAQQTAKAQASLERLPSGPARDSLHELAELTVRRTA